MSCVFIPVPPRWSREIIYFGVWSREIIIYGLGYHWTPTKYMMCMCENITIKYLFLFTMNFFVVFSTGFLYVAIAVLELTL